MTYICCCPPIPRRKAILVPSGQHGEVRSGTAFSVNTSRPLPSGFITQISKGVPGLCLHKYKILVPSGDQSGDLSSRLLNVRRTGFVPSAFITHISAAAWHSAAASAKVSGGLGPHAEFRLVKTILSPFGDQSASSSLWPSKVSVMFVGASP